MPTLPQVNMPQNADTGFFLINRNRLFLYILQYDIQYLLEDYRLKFAVPHRYHTMTAFCIKTADRFSIWIHCDRILCFVAIVAEMFSTENR